MQIFALPVKEGLPALTLEPTDVIELQVVTISMSRVNLRTRVEMSIVRGKSISKSRRKNNLQTYSL